METFNYSKELLLNILFWVMIATTVGYIIFASITGSSEESKKWPWKLSGITFIAALCVISAIIVVNQGKTQALNEYTQGVETYMKTVGQFDSVNGKLSFDPAEPGIYKVKIGDKEGQCLVAYPENKGDQLEFGCGDTFVPLDKAKAEILGQPSNEDEPKK